MNEQLRNALVKLRSAMKPEDIFGPINTNRIQKMRAIKERLMRQVHPDRNADAPTEAEEAFKLLMKLWERVEEILNGPVVTVITKSHRYTLTGSAETREPATVHDCTDEAGNWRLLKVAGDPADNDLMKTEVGILRHLRKVDTKQEIILPYLPEPVEDFLYSGGGAARQATVFASIDGLVSLADIRRAYPDGIDPQDAAWMWRRLLMVLDHAHSRGVIHGAVLPTNVLIHPEQHGLILANWCYAVRDPAQTDQRITAIDQNYENWYPQEVLNKEFPTPAIDLVMSARCMIELMGGNPVRGLLPTGANPRLRRFFQGCTLGSLRLGPQNAWGLREEFTELIEQLWGRRAFRPFVMPTAVTA